ncbi:MAG: ATP-dependent acyl-CoA ligase [Gammaproteobacteria bacterium]|nr:MAG: ATP-dependent acyl-CoA ligase [Gammaproteobacteria bacterium]
MPDLSIIANLIADWATKKPNLDVLTFVSIDSKGNYVEQTRTYQQLWDNGQRLAAWLKAQGIEKNDAFGIVMQNHPEFVDLMVASSIVGSIFVPIDSRVRGEKLKYMLDFAGCKGAVVANYAIDNVRAVWADREKNWILPLTSESQIEGIETAADILSRSIPSPPLPIESTDSAAPMQMLYTSGTTGDPKAILSAHNRFAAVPVIGNVLGLAAKDRPYTGLSLTHANAQIITLGCTLVLGLRGVISLKFTKSHIWDITRKYGCTWFNLLGGMTTAVFADPTKDNDADNPVRIILSAGMPIAIWKDFESRFDIKIAEFYGAAEGGLTFNPAGVGPVGSCGKAPPNMELKIFDTDGNECAPGDGGEICFRNADGSTPIVNYFKNPEASKEKTEGGWLHMGDVGHLDEQGWLYFDYRIGGGIRRNGDFINPAFVEKVLSQIASIDDVFVYGMSMPGMAPGEKEPVAAIVLAEGSSFDADEIFSQCHSDLEANFVPAFLQVVKEIPKTASEKPLERFLLDAFDINASNIHATANY